MKKILNAGDVFHLRTVTDLTKEIFDCNIPYRTFYFKPKALQNRIKGGFYIWIGKFSEDGCVHDCRNGFVWQYKIDATMSKIESRFIGNRSCLTDEIMDMHGKKILVFFDKRKEENAFEFLGVFGENGIIYSHNEYVGTNYIKLNDSISIEMPKPEIEKNEQTHPKTLKELLADRSESIFYLKIFEEFKDKFPDDYRRTKEEIERIDAEIEERFGKIE